MLSTAYGVRQVDRSTNRILVQCIKPRDIDPLGPFEIQGRPFIRDVGDFRVVTEPSNRSCTELLSESKERNAEAEAIELFGQGLSGNKVEEELKKKGLGIRRTTVQEWKRRYGEGSGSQGRFPPKKEPAEPAQVNTL